MKSIKSKNIVFVTGAFVNNSCWNEWKYYFQSRGYSTIAPPWPFKDASTTELRNRQPNDTGLAAAAKVDYKKPHAPLLLTSGSTDTIIPAHINIRNFKKYAKNDSVLDYKEFEGRNHFVLGQSTWKEDADNILNWIDQH